MFTNRDFIERVMASTTNPIIIQECREMIKKEESYIAKRRAERQERARKIKDEILAYCNSIDNKYADNLEIANALDRPEAQISYYVRELERDKELPERREAKDKKIDKCIKDISKLLKYGEIYTNISISKALNNKYHHNLITCALYKMVNSNNTECKVNSFNKEERRDGRNVTITYWIKA
jgi:hypothetical protein